MTALEPIQATPAYAESGFRFLTALGFQLHERWVSGGQSFRDGWRLSYSSPAVEVMVAYLDMQLEVVGNMFPPQKLAAALDRVSTDIRDHYGLVLAGDEATWRGIARALEVLEPIAMTALPNYSMNPAAGGRHPPSCRVGQSPAAGQAGR